MTYTAPLAEQRFVLETVADLAAFADIDGDLVSSILEESGKLASGIFAPLNREGDKQGAKWSPEGVTLPAGFREAYTSYVEYGWASLDVSPDHGGQGLPFVVATAAQEQLTSANMALSLCTMLGKGAISALTVHGSDALKAAYVPKLVSGEWTGTMNLTEPQAGSDVGAVRTTATPAGDGSYRITGSKIFITWGEHDLAENIVHLVLARLPGAEPGTRGLSLFVVPKFLPDGDGNPGQRNDLRCVSIEHKLGIHASPTCTMSFGDNGHCVGWLVGHEHGGIRAMFTMMNHARISVGCQGVAIAERAYQGAVAYARERVQSGQAIVNYPDVRRMLMTMRALTQAARAITYFTAAAVDRAHGGASETERRADQGIADLLTPICKSWCTDVGVEVASLGIQIFGGMGYIEETGAAQHLRDARIAPIYEGTNGIQAMDLVGRKLRLENGAVHAGLFDEIGKAANEDARLRDALTTLREATDVVLVGDARSAGAAASPYLRMFALVVGGWLMLRQSQAAKDRRERGEGDPHFLAAKIATAEFFLQQILPQVNGIAAAVNSSADQLFALDDDQLAH